MKRSIMSVMQLVWAQGARHGPAFTERSARQAGVPLGVLMSRPVGTAPSAATCAHIATAGAKQPSSVDPKEARKFAQLANEWWHPRGPFAPLHSLNPARVKFIRDAVCAMQGLEDAAPAPFSGLRVLDVGCGGGILTEALARLGAHVLGIDVSHENVAVATAHAAADPLTSSRVRYECTTLEALVASNGDRSAPHFDLVVASEVLEHVRRPDVFMRALTAAVAPAGSLVVSTLNRTPLSWAVGIVGAEYVTGIVPRGTHEWHRFITPQELFLMADVVGLSIAHAAGMKLDVQRGTFSLTDDLSVNYITAFHKPGLPGADTK